MKDQKEEEKELLWSYEPIDELIPQELFFIRSPKLVKLAILAVQSQKLLNLMPAIVSSFVMNAVALKFQIESVSEYAVGQGVQT